ncbi:MAG: FAD-binding domain-containing protein [Wenzhouxiangella sp.]|jgi:deoxyribodipyrimidine photolyase|nr:FAD-binding domain-containing protein [Wenzhouxiangella sp.]
MQKLCAPLDLFPPTRSAALARLADFVPRAGRAYAAERNADPGPGFKPNVSMLSPYLRHRILTEREVIAAVVEQHSPSQAEKFIQEVFWRTYWKGWLQMRPQVWRDFLAERDAERERVGANSGLARALAEAESGRTGIECFDDWVHELVASGYLHNHVRMWFASIWIFTLKLPWTLGAEFFLRHLLDADPASNTLSWRWVAGIQTAGKTYLARPDNIEKYTQGRYRPTDLAETADPIRDEAPYSRVDLEELPTVASDKPSLLLVHGDDLSASACLGGEFDLRGAVVASAGHEQDPWPFGDKAEAFVQAAATDAAESLRKEQDFEVVIRDTLDAEAICRQAQAAGVATVVTSEAPVGPLADGLERLARELDQRAITLYRVRNVWDARAWPNAVKGFFPFKRKIPELVQQGLAG